MNDQDPYTAEQLRVIEDLLLNLGPQSTKPNSSNNGDMASAHLDTPIGSSTTPSFGMEEIRCDYRTIPITPEQAQAERDDAIKLIRKRANLEILSILSESLPKTKQIMVDLKPGDEGYENAPFGWEWKSIS